MNRSKYIWCLGVLALMVSSCKVGPDYEQPENAFVPADWKAIDSTLGIDTAVMNPDWWTYFDDPVLDSLIHMALANNKNALIAAQRVERARLALGIQKAELLPKFGYLANAQRGNFVQNQISQDPSTLLATGATMSWELDFWGKYRRLNESARADLMAQMNAQRSLQISLIYQVAATYFELLEYRKRLQIAHETTSLRDSTLRLIKDRYQGGIIPEIDVNQAEIQYAISASSIPLYERLSAQTEQVLSVLVGLPPQPIPSGSPIEDQRYDQEVRVAVPSAILKFRPDILQAEQNLIASNAIIGVRTAELFPSISLTGTLAAAGSPTSFGQGAIWNASAGLVGPLFYWQQNLRRVDVAEVETQIALLDYEQTVLEAFQEVELAITKIKTLRDEVVARELHVRAAKNAQDLSYSRYDQGVTSYLEYLETQRQYFEAQNFLTSAQADLLSAYLDLYRATGGGWISEDEKAEAQSTEQQ